MTELETLERAKMYMEKLANGINPIDGTVIPDEDVVNNVRLSRCFFYVADVLRQVIDNGGVTPQKRQKKEPFFLPINRRAAFEYSTVPIPVSEIASRLNALSTQENMAALGYAAIRNWLISLGMLDDTLDENGNTVKHPTPYGESIGIQLETRTGKNGSYFVVVYNVDAQHFVVDNLDAIIEFLNAKKENQGKPWSEEHDKQLRDLHQSGVPVKEMAMALRRNNHAIRSRLKKLGLAEL